jgi:phage-related protein
MGGANAAAALAFVRARNGVEAFWWKNPFEVTKLYKCSKWSFGRQRGYNVLNMTFEQVFESAT